LSQHTQSSTSSLSNIKLALGCGQTLDYQTIKLAVANIEAARAKLPKPSQTYPGYQISSSLIHLYLYCLFAGGLVFAEALETSLGPFQNKIFGTIFSFLGWIRALLQEHRNRESLHAHRAFVSTPTLRSRCSMLLPLVSCIFNLRGRATRTARAAGGFQVNAGWRGQAGSPNSWAHRPTFCFASSP
jgi:hypothetical protein